jgi:hypothetical protein
MTVRLAGAPSTEEQARHIREGFGLARCDDWVARAQPGTVKIYAVGLNAREAAAEGVGARLFALAEAGLVVLTRARTPREDGDTAHPFDFFARRTARALPPGWPKLPVVVAVRRVMTSKVPGRKE